MREKLLICVSAQQATAAHWRAGRIAKLEQFAHDERGFTGFRDFLAPYSNVPVFLMVDAVEEDYRFETLPHSWGSERALLEKLQVKTPNLLIAAQHSGGLRLTFFRDRQFRLSRLTRGDGSKTIDPVRLFAGEISNTRLYLHALRTATLDEHLTVLLLDRNDELEGVAAAITQENPALDCVRIGRAELASRLSMDPQLLAATPEALYLQVL